LARLPKNLASFWRAKPKAAHHCAAGKSCKFLHQAHLAATAFPYAFSFFPVWRDYPKTWQVFGAQNLRRLIIVPPATVANFRIRLI